MGEGSPTNMRQNLTGHSSDEMDEIECALTFLTAGEVILQDEPGFWYQLGSYHARLGDLLKAKQAVSRLETPVLLPDPIARLN